MGRETHYIGSGTVTAAPPSEALIRVRCACQVPVTFPRRANQANRPDSFPARSQTGNSVADTDTTDNTDPMLEQFGL